MNRRQGRLLALPLGILVLAATACAGLRDDRTGPGTGTGSEGFDHSSGPSDIVFRMDVAGGFVPYDWTLRHIPTFSMYGDGRIVTEGPQIEIYPGPALPNLLARGVDEAGIQAILQASKDAGLMGPDAHYQYNCIADAATTTFTVVADGTTHVVSVYAMGDDFEPEPGEPGEPEQPGEAPPTEGAARVAEEVAPCVPDDQRAPRAILAAFAAQLTDLGSWLPAGSLGEEEIFVFDGLAIFVGPYGSPDPEATEQQPVAWPLDESPDTFGEPIDESSGIRCGTVEGEELDSLLPLVQGANTLTPWERGGVVYAANFRPLLPDEAACQDLGLPGSEV